MQIYKQYNQQQLNLQYNTRLGVPDFETYLEKWETLSRLAENELHFIKDIPYGNLLRECLDVFPSGVTGSKTLLLFMEVIGKGLINRSFILLPAHLQNTMLPRC